MNMKKIEEAIKTILIEIGEDPNRNGLLETPKRVAKAYKELFEGYTISNKEILNKQFETTYNNGVVKVSGIPVYTFCEHHMLPFFGTCDIEYKPNNGLVVGLSKLNRLVRNCSRRLNTQEQLTDNIGLAIIENLKASYCKIKVECRHMCVEMRGVNQSGSSTITEKEFTFKG